MRRGGTAAAAAAVGAQVTSAAEAVAHERNGYRAWALYTHVRQGELELERGAAATLARAMLHIDHDLFELRCVQRTAAVLEHARGAGNVSAELLEACAAACAIAGEPEGCAALVDEAAALCGGVAPPRCTPRSSRRTARRARSTTPSRTTAASRPRPAAARRPACCRSR